MRARHRAALQTAPAVANARACARAPRGGTRAGGGHAPRGECFAVTGIQGSSAVLTCSRWYPSQPGVMHRLSADPVKDCESWDHSDVCRDCVH